MDAAKKSRTSQMRPNTESIRNLLPLPHSPFHSPRPDSCAAPDYPSPRIKPPPNATSGSAPATGSVPAAAIWSVRFAYNNCTILAGCIGYPVCSDQHSFLSGTDPASSEICAESGSVPIRFGTAVAAGPRAGCWWTGAASWQRKIGASSAGNCRGCGVAARADIRCAQHKAGRTRQTDCPAIQMSDFRGSDVFFSRAR